MPIFTFIGVPALIAKGLDAAEKGVQQAAEHLVGASQAAAPVDTGTLRASIHVSGIDKSAGAITARIETSGEANEYAVYQHDGTSRGVPATKFLEGPLISNAGLYKAFIEAAYRSGF